MDAEWRSLARPQHPPPAEEGLAQRTPRPQLNAMDCTDNAWFSPTNLIVSFFKLVAGH